MEEPTTVTPMGAKVWPREQNKGVRTVMKYDAWALHPVAFRVSGMHGPKTVPLPEEVGN